MRCRRTYVLNKWKKANNVIILVELKLNKISRNSANMTNALLKSKVHILLEMYD